MDDSGNPCLGDFGLSRMVEDSTLWHTSATHVSGTTRWKAPELLNSGEKENEKTDVWALGMVLLVSESS